MTTIDHRILIPAPPDVVWDYISDITHNPDWQIDCRDVIFLTSRREGPGVRWRYTKPDGHESVVAVSAWYNGLGYEYYYVDGMPFRENKGRIRLQEIPEGTIVQWTFTYELGGLLGGMRNALGVSRDVDHTIADSLKTLWQKIKQSSGTVSRVYEAKSLMRDAPDVEARSNYQPRHPSHSGQADGEAQEHEPMLEPPIREDDGQPISIISEPPIKEGDTRPRVGVTASQEAAAVPADIDGEPEFLDRVVDLSRFEPPRTPSDTQPKHPVAPVEAEKTAPEPAREREPVLLTGEETEPLGFTPPESLPDYESAPLVLERDERTAPAAALEELAEETQPEYRRERFAPPRISDEPKPTEESTPEIEGVEPATSVSIDTPVSVPAPPPTEPTPQVKPASEPEPTEEPSAASPSGSIWEVFGVPRPSETQTTAPVSAEPTVTAIREKSAPVNSITRAGLRLSLRRRLVRVRRI